MTSSSCSLLFPHVKFHRYLKITAELSEFGHRQHVVTVTSTLLKQPQNTAEVTQSHTITGNADVGSIIRRLGQMQRTHTCKDADRAWRHNPCVILYQRALKGDAFVLLHKSGCILQLTLNCHLMIRCVCFYFLQCVFCLPYDLL